MAGVRRSDSTVAMRKNRRRSRRKRKVIKNGKGKKEKVAEIKQKMEEELLEDVAEDQRSDEDVLAQIPSEVNLDGKIIEFGEWSFGEFAQIGDVVDNMIRDLEDHGINPMLLFFRPASHLYETQVLGKEDDIDQDILEVFHKELEKEANDVTRLFARVAPYAFRIVQFTCKLTDEEMDALSPDDGIGIFNLIMLQNHTLLGKSYSLFGKHL